ncbi:MAG: hypothetical protein SGI73_01390 [Chloroflexota bacterium]|nr:hypothetical protein [Chloroflexota bacterium]
MSIQTPSDNSSPNAGQPEPKVYFPPTKGEYKDRSGCLWVWLALATVLTLFSYRTVIGIAVEVFTPGTLNAPPTSKLAVFAVIALINLIALFGIWRWKQWGIYSFALASILNFVALVAYNQASYIDIPALVASVGLMFVVTGEDQHNFD